MTTPIDVSEEAVEWLAGQCGKGPMSQRYATTLRELRRQLTAAQASQRERDRKIASLFLQIGRSCAGQMGVDIDGELDAFNARDKDASSG